MTTKDNFRLIASILQQSRLNFAGDLLNGDLAQESAAAQYESCCLSLAGLFEGEPEFDYDLFVLQCLPPQ